MKLLLDGRPAYGGIARATSGLVTGLRQALPQGDLVVFGDDHESGRLRFLPWWRRVARTIGGSASHVITDQRRLPSTARRHRVDLFHSPVNHVIPLRIGVPGVVTLYDLSLVDHWHTKSRALITRYERWAFLDAVRRAARIITISDTVQQELVTRLGIDETRITRIYPEIPRLELLPPPAELPREAAGSFLLSVGTLEPRKNLERLLKAHELVLHELQIPLLLVGVYGWSQRAVVRRVAAAVETARWLGWVEDGVLAELYRRASAVVQYSTYEGFDLPLAEGLACGAPVVLSDIPVHREVAGECGVYADPRDPKALARALIEVVGWSEDRRQTHREAALRRVAELRRGDPIARHLEAYQRALTSASSRNSIQGAS